MALRTVTLSLTNINQLVSVIEAQGVFCQIRAIKSETFPSYRFDDFVLFCSYLSRRLIKTLYSYKKTNSVVSVRKQTILTERPPLVGEFSAHFSG
jgi:hypothetical protein